MPARQGRGPGEEKIIRDVPGRIAYSRQVFPLALGSFPSSNHCPPRAQVRKQISTEAENTIL